MSLRSMTGYGRAAVQGGGLRVEVEISSVNRKQLDIVVSSAKGFSVLESRIHEEVAAAVARGRVSVAIEVRRVESEGSPCVRVNLGIAREYCDALRRAAKILQVPDQIGIEFLAGLPGVLETEIGAEDPEQVWPLLREALRKALSQLDGMRRREGRVLGRDLLARVAKMRKTAAIIRRLGPASVARHREQLRARVREALGAAADIEQTLAREVAFFAERSDIVEECVRIESHLEQCRKLLREETAEPVGKTLDFLAQELNREIHTIASKSADAEIAQRVVEFRAELERFREQVQNLQ